MIIPISDSVTLKRLIGLKGDQMPQFAPGVPRIQDYQCKTRGVLGKPRQVGPPHLGRLSSFTDRSKLLPELSVFK